jgi:hypothetical protein
MPKKMPRRLVALSSSAITAIYFAGFVATRAADAGIAPFIQAVVFLTGNAALAARRSLLSAPARARLDHRLTSA